ncbi:MAG: lipopolysaccharide biosynthesis protein RfbH [Oscillospiraceae bacterium]|jgi:CDP-6-deoxy-D-xylo-4-hexulose-3-dehydrase|nr:lipopolysaccharide biosynthesis protein RfbH [Oscillospiraceae bacterium]
MKTVIPASAQAQAREEILRLVREYCGAYHSQEPAPGARIPYARRVYDGEEMACLVDAALDFWLTPGRCAEEFETGLARFLGSSHCLLVNSGSSANLLAFMALTSPLLGARAIRPGDEVLTVAAGFPTTVSPILQYGAVPVFADITIPQYNIDVSLLERAWSPRMKAVMMAHTLGNPFDILAVKAFCRAHGLWLIEDNCDALGSQYTLAGKTGCTGTFGDIGTSSFYPSHHITTGEGGAVYTDDELLAKILRSMRDWGRDCECPPGRDNLCGRRFGGPYGTLPAGYDHKYVYSHFGYNLKATEMQAAVGCAQLKKLPRFIERRRANFQRLYALLEPLQDRLILPQATKNAQPSWFGFPITCREGIERTALVKAIEGKGVQTRMLFAGNILRHPCFAHVPAGAYRVTDALQNSDIVTERSFWVGVYPGLTDAQVDYMGQTIAEATERTP